ncbi:MAG: hypothetical protein GC160_13290 [Acidobacteria bacterium]|nr:hypothetical protein [Acidobacteriota bacterium]
MPTRFENGYLALLGALMFASLLWALVPPAEGLFSNPVDRALAELTQLGQSATQALACAAVVGGPLFLVGFLQYALERRLGKGNSSLLLGAATVSVALGLGVMDSIRADVLLFGGMIGASLIVAYRSVPRLAVWAGGVAGGFFLVAAAIQVVTVVAAGAYESAAAVGGLLARSW